MADILLRRGWEIKRLDEVCEINPSRKEVASLPDGLDVSFVPMAAVSEDGRLLEAKTKKVGEVRKGFPHFKEKDVLVAKITPCFENGKRWLASSLTNGVGFGSTEFHVLRAIAGVLPEWIYYAVSLPEFRRDGQRRMTGTAGQKRVPSSFLGGYMIPVPPPAVQEEIVAVLQRAERLREIREQANNFTNRIIQSVFLKMFGDPGENPMGWDKAKLADVVRIVGGGTPSTSEPKYWNGSIPWISPKDMKTLIIADTIDHVSEQAVAAGKTKLVPAENVLVVIRSGILKKHLPLAINSVPAAINQDLKALLPLVKIDPYYLLFHLRAVGGDLLKTVKGTTADNISTTTLRETQIMIPPFRSQERFSNVAKRIFNLADKQNKSAEEINELFQSLMHKTFTEESSLQTDERNA
jgi:type I restriction enzyme S subunit